MHTGRAAALNAEINVTPLVDVCLVLLIIFMVVTPMMVNAVPVELPKSVTATATEPHKQLAITVKEDGTLYLDASVIRREQLDSELHQRHDVDAARPVVLRADKRVHYGEVMATLDACRKAGYENVGLISQSAVTNPARSSARIGSGAQNNLSPGRGHPHVSVGLPVQSQRM